MKKLLARMFMAWAGFEPGGQRPAARRFVLLGVPHTSNWDLAFLLAFGAHFDLRYSFMAKRELFRWPLGPLMRWIGGIPVNRGKRENVVDQMAAVLNDRSDMSLVITPEGTRSYTPHWRSGFYHIALRAGVPIVLGFVDYDTKRCGIGPEIIPTGNVSEDMDMIREFYADKRARYPDQFGEVRLKEEM